jgi:hypothetical protein
MLYTDFETSLKQMHPKILAFSNYSFKGKANEGKFLFQRNYEEKLALFSIS